MNSTEKNIDFLLEDCDSVLKFKNFEPQKRKLK